MTAEEKEKLLKSIKYAEDTLEKGLILDIDAQMQLRRMIDYYKIKIAAAEKGAL